MEIELYASLSHGPRAHVCPSRKLSHIELIQRLPSAATCGNLTEKCPAATRTIANRCAKRSPCVLRGVLRAPDPNSDLRDPLEGSPAGNCTGSCDRLSSPVCTFKLHLPKEYVSVNPLLQPPPNAQKPNVLQYPPSRSASGTQTLITMRHDLLKQVLTTEA